MNGGLHVTGRRGRRSRLDGEWRRHRGAEWRSSWQWQRASDLRTSNGGVHLYIPSGYSALLETGTVNGRSDVGFPMTVQGAFGRSFHDAARQWRRRDDPRHDERREYRLAEIDR